MSPRSGNGRRLISVLDRSGLPGEAVDDVVLGHSYPTMEAPATGRVAALDAGLPVSVTGLQLARRCGSGLQAVLYAALQVPAGVSEVVLAGGAESMSSAPFYSTAMRWGACSGPRVLPASPDRDFGASMVQYDDGGRPVLHGTVRDETGQPITGACLDVWQNGF